MIQSLYPCFRKWSERGTVWLYADTHFGEADVRRRNPDRPDDDEHVRRIVRRCGKKDTLILLGDVGDPEYARKLRGHKILICGNHDAGGTTYRDIFDEVYTGPLFISEKILLTHERVEFPGAFNIHGHDHVAQDTDGTHWNVCADVIGYEPASLDRMIKSGMFSKIYTTHRSTIDYATRRARAKARQQDRHATKNDGKGRTERHG